MLASPITDCRRCPLGAASSDPCPFTPVRLKAGAVVGGQGAAASLAFVCDGLVSVAAADPDGVERGVALRGPGSLLGLEALFGGSPTHEVRALVATRVCVLDARDAKRWLGPGHSPALALAVLALREIREHHADAGRRRGNGTTRLARLLLDHPKVSTLGVPKQALAAALGMRPETFSRCLRRLVDAGLVEPRSGRVRDAKRLAALVSSATR